jgi:Zn-dependent protease/CBS domain-containing protein
MTNAIKRSLVKIKVAGIPVAVHWSFLLLLLWIAVSAWRAGGGLTGILLSVAFTVAIFICIALHELGHALAARRFDIVTSDITLYPIGGIAHLSRIPEAPAQELAVAVAGPLVNLVLGAVFHIGAWLTTDANLLANFATEGLKPSTFIVFLATANFSLAVFNLIPAFPMDGGRVLRALLAFRMSRVKATSIAASVGQVMAFFMAVAGILYGQPFLVLIGLFVFWGAAVEAQAVKNNDLLKSFTVNDAIRTHYLVLHPGDTVERAVSALLKGNDTEFVVLDDEQVAGILTRSDIIRAISSGQGMTIQVSRIMRREFLTIESTARLTAAQSLLAESGQTLLPVIDKGQLRGIIDAENILEMIMLRAALNEKQAVTSIPPSRPGHDDDRAAA